ncbi:MAG: hypothetical protein ACRBFS_00865 [Aureispira sp.]
MTRIELAYKVLEEEKQLLWVDDIWRLATEKGYVNQLPQQYDELEHNINALDDALYQKVGQGRLRLLEEKGQYYLTNFKQLPLKIESALHGPSCIHFKEVQETGTAKHFKPSTRGFDGMVLFFILAIGLPLSLYLTTIFQGSLALSLLSMLLMAGLLSFFALLAYAYLQLTNATLIIAPEHLECYYLFYPKKLQFKVNWTQLTKIEACGLGEELQLKSDVKYLVFHYQTEEGEARTRTIRCHGYINPSPHYDPFSILIRNYESFVLLRAFLKEIAELYAITYEER